MFEAMAVLRHSGAVAPFKVFFYLKFLRHKFISQHAILEEVQVLFLSQITANSKQQAK